MEAIEPSYYKYVVKNTKGESIECTYFDIAEALNLSREWSFAVKYSRSKDGIEKDINDSEKAKRCIDLHIAKQKIRLEEYRKTQLF